MKRISPREQRRLLERMGLSVKSLDNVLEVQIRLPDRVITLRNPAVSVIEVKGGGRIYQVSGEEVESPLAPQLEVSEEDVQLVAAQANCSLEEARAALREAGGDIAKAILLASSRKSS
ncbi:MAG: nascent polypeptide-associated complex protein [Thermofilum sp.]|uniref:Nascent polypeptide-associated complex protein n=1 Tax=Thermofilum pendens TaxID=2269 RepID=A0A7C4H7V8_THEPE